MFSRLFAYVRENFVGILIGLSIGLGLVFGANQAHFYWDRHNSQHLSTDRNFGEIVRWSIEIEKRLRALEKGQKPGVQ